MAHQPIESSALTGKVSLQLVFTIAISLASAVGTYTVLQYRVDSQDEQIAEIRRDLKPLTSDVAVVKEQVRATSEAVNRIEQRLLR